MLVPGCCMESLRLTADRFVTDGYPAPSTFNLAAAWSAQGCCLA